MAEEEWPLMDMALEKMQQMQEVFFSVNEEIPFVPAYLCHISIVALVYMSYRGLKKRITWPFIRRIIEVAWRVVFPFLAYKNLYIPVNKFICVVYASVEDEDQKWMLTVASSVLFTVITVLWALYLHHRRQFNERGIYLPFRLPGSLRRIKWFRNCSPLPSRPPRLPTIAEIKAIIFAIIRLIKLPFTTLMNVIRRRRSAQN